MLHLTEHDRILLLQPPEVELALASLGQSRGGQDDAPGAEDGPVLRQLALEGGEHLLLGLRGAAFDLAHGRMKIVQDTGQPSLAGTGRS